MTLVLAGKYEKNAAEESAKGRENQISRPFAQLVKERRFSKEENLRFGIKCGKHMRNKLQKGVFPTPICQLF